MKRRTAIILGVTAAILVGGAATVYSVGPYRAAGYAAHMVGPSPAFAHGRQGWRRHGGRSGFVHICGEQRDQRLDNAIEFADAFLKLEGPQTEAWNKLTAAMRAGSARVGEACQSISTNGSADSAPAKLAALETVTIAAADIVREVRPAFDVFYETLDDKQRAALDGLLNRHHR